jgi:hypothetical protein
MVCTAVDSIEPIVGPDGVVDAIVRVTTLELLSGGGMTAPVVVIGPTVVILCSTTGVETVVEVVPIVLLEVAIVGGPGVLTLVTVAGSVVMLCEMTIVVSG